MEEFKISDPLKHLAYAPFRAWLREGYRSADRVVATDHSMRDEVSALLGIDPARVAVLPNGVDVAEITGVVDAHLADVLAEKWQIKRGFADSLVGISVGRMEANKGFDHLLGALASCQDRIGEGWHWFFVGDGTQRGRLEALAAAQGLIEHVTFPGSVTDSELHTLYSMCNLFVHPTLYEGSSLVTLEAMAHGLPVIASATGGIPDKVVDGVTGFLVKPGDEAVLGERIAWIAAHTPERRQMGLRGLEIVSRRFSWTQVAEATEALLSTLIDEKAACNSVEVTTPSC
jgi:glycosyltransferase involved in cell wall biosynthesis